MTKCVVPFSGGMDSTTILYHALTTHDEIHALPIMYGQRHLRKEIEAGLKLIHNLQDQYPNRIVYRPLDLAIFKTIANVSALTNDGIDVAKAKDVMGDPQTVNYVPFRNMMMLSVCSAYAESIGADTV